MSNRSSTVAVALAAFLIGIGVYALTLGSSSSAQDSAATGGDTADKGPAESADAATISDLVDVVFPEGVQSSYVRLQWIDAREWSTRHVFPGVLSIALPGQNTRLSTLPDQFYIRVFNSTGSTKPDSTLPRNEMNKKHEHVEIAYGYESEWQLIDKSQFGSKNPKVTLKCFESNAVILSVSSPDFRIPRGRPFSVWIAPAVTDSPPARTRRGEPLSIKSGEFLVYAGHPYTYCLEPGRYWICTNRGQYTQFTTELVQVTQGHKAHEINVRARESTRVLTVDLEIGETTFNSSDQLKFKLRYKKFEGYTSRRRDTVLAKWKDEELEAYQGEEGSYHVLVSPNIVDRGAHYFLSARTTNAGCHSVDISRSIAGTDPGPIKMRLHPFLSVRYSIEGVDPQIADKLFRIRLAPPAETQALMGSVINPYVHGLLAGDSKDRKARVSHFGSTYTLPGRYSFTLYRASSGSYTYLKELIEISPDKVVFEFSLPELNSITLKSVLRDDQNSKWKTPTLFAVNPEGKDSSLGSSVLTEDGDLVFPALPHGEYRVEGPGMRGGYSFKLIKDTTLDLKSFREGG